MENYEVKIIQSEGTIQCDFESAKKYLEGRLEEYKGVVFTEDTKADAKATVAGLRKEKKAFSDRVKEARDAYMKPFESFMAQANELIGMYDQPIEFINSQVEDFERRRIAEKQEYIKHLYQEYIGDMADILPLVKIYNPKWENATTSRKAICEEICTRRDAVRSSMASIRNMHSEAEEKAIEIFKKTLDVSQAMLYISQYEAQKAEILRQEQERIRREEEERIRREEREKIEAEQRAREAERRAREEKEEAIRRAEAEKQEALIRAEEEKQAAVEAAKEDTAQEVIDSLIGSGEGDSNLYEYRLSLTADQKEKLERYLDSVGIDWEEI